MSAHVGTEVSVAGRTDAEGPSTGRTVAEGIVDVLVAAGVREVFGIAGGALTPLLQALHRCDEVRYVGVRHEFAAAAMAAAVYQATGRVAVCLGEQGPGTLNLVSGLGVAHNNSLAVLAISVSGHSVTSGPGSGALMELDATLLSQAVTTFRRRVTDPESVVGAVSEALLAAVDGRPGPVHVDIPRDVIGAPIARAVPSWSGPARTDLPGAELDGAARLLLAAERPLVIAGGGATGDGVDADLAALARHLGAATATTQMGIGVLPSDGADFVGQGGVIAGPALIRAAREADVVLAVGCRFSSWWWRDGHRLIERSRLVQIDTDPALLGRATVGLHGRAEDLVGPLLARVRERPARPVGEWVSQLREEFAAHRRRLAELAADPGRPSHPASLAARLAQLSDPEDLVVLDGGHTSFWSNDFMPARAPRRIFHEPGMAQLGFGVPYANALALAFPERRVVTITGDGAFGFSLVELDTARRYGLRTITVVHDNALWGVIGLAQRRAGFSLGTDLGGTDYASIARGFGCLGLTVDDVDDLDTAWEKARASEMPAVIDVRVRFEPHPMMPDFGRTTAGGPS